MKKRFKIEPIYDGNLWYAVYQKRFLWGWKYLDKFCVESNAIKMAKTLAEPPISIYVETK
jgi:hypothetical protein